MDKRDLKVIKGGLPDDALPSDIAPSRDRTFVSAWATDTRLMAVVCMHIHWKVSSGELETDEHQFLYFDAVDTGFERFEKTDSDDEKALLEKEISFAGGLGGRKVGLDEKEAIFLVKHFCNMNKRRGLEFPKNKGEYMFLLRMDGKLTPDEEADLFRRLTVKMKSVYEVMNYFMMQIVNRDEECIRFLSDGRLGKEACPKKLTGTLYKNDLKLLDRETNTYQAESLIETDSGYEVWLSSIKMDGDNVEDYKMTSRLEISDTEAYLALSHSEFIMVYELNESQDLPQDSTPLTRRSSRVEEEDGYSYMLFRPNNDHVDTKNYRLYQDIFGIYHVTTTGQLICAANDQRDMGMLEIDLVFSPLFQQMDLAGNYEFNEPVMAQFLASGYDDFNEFMSEITDGE